MSKFTYTPSMTPDLADALAYETSLPAIDTSGGFEDPAVAEWHRARLAHASSTPTLSSTGRRSFKVTGTSERFDFSTHVDYDGSLAPERTTVRTRARDLIALADEWMLDHAETCEGCEGCGWHDDACTDDGCVRTCEHRPIRLMGRDGDGRQYQQVVRGDRSDNSGDAPGEFAGWPSRYGVRGLYGDAAKPRTVTVTNPCYGSDGMPTVLTVVAVPSAAGTVGRVHIGCDTYDADAPVKVQRQQSRQARLDVEHEKLVNAPVLDVEDIGALWSQLAPGTAVEAQVNGHLMSLRMPASGGRVTVTYSGSTWQARTPRSIAARIGGDTVTTTVGTSDGEAEATVIVHAPADAERQAEWLAEHGRIR